MSSRLALVTGAGAGLARGIALALARSGYRVAFTFRSGGTAPDETATLLRAHDPAVLAIEADHAVAGTGSLVVAAVERERGPIDILVHAVGPIVVKRFEQSTYAEYRAMIAGNLDSSVELAFALAPGMRARGFGRFVFFGMNGSHATQPARGMSLYGAAKAGVVTFARALALEEATYGITSNVIEPGDIRDKRATRAEARAIVANNPTGRAGSWEDIGDAVRFVVSDDASYLNGMVLGVNGGLVEAHE